MVIKSADTQQIRVAGSDQISNLETESAVPTTPAANVLKDPEASNAMLLRSLLLRTLSETIYAFLVLLTTVAAGLSCTALLSQAVRTSPTRNYANPNAIIIGVAYTVLLGFSLGFCVMRRVAVRRKLQRISKTYRVIGKDDLPNSVHKYVTHEYVRACLVSYDSLPKDVYHEGWGRPGTKYAGVRFRRALLDTIPRIDTLAHQIIPLHPTLKPHARMLRHFRFLMPLLPKDEDGLTPLHYYDSAVQVARNLSSGKEGKEMTEEEFEVGMRAAEGIEKCLNECRLEMLEEDSDSTMRLDADEQPFISVQ